MTDFDNDPEDNNSTTSFQTNTDHSDPIVSAETVPDSLPYFHSPLTDNTIINEIPDKSLESPKNILIDVKDKNNPQMETESSDEDEDYTVELENPINPIQLISKLIKQGPRAAVRQYKQTVSESRENVGSTRQSNLYLHSRLDSTSRHDECDMTMDNASAGPICDGATEDSSTTFQNPLFFNRQYRTNQALHKPSVIQSDCEIFKSRSSVREDETIVSSDFQSTISIELKDTNIDPGTHWNKFKDSLLVFYYLIQTTTDQLIKWLNVQAQEYCRISRKLKIEKQLFKQSVLSTCFGEIDGKLDQVEEYIGDGSKPFETTVKKYDIPKEQKFRHNRFFSLLISLGHVTTIYSEFICYFLLIFNHMKSGNLLSLPYPLMVFLWAMLSVPRPTKKFWIVLITYTEIVIVIKYMFQFNFITFNIPQAASTKTDTLWISLIGIEKSKNYAILDVVQLFFVFIHRGYLKSNGLWRDHAEFVQDLKIFDQMKNETNDVHELSDDRTVTDRKHSWNPIHKIRHFYFKMINPELNKKVDVYSFMFGCEFLSFVIIILGYVSFGPGTDSADNAIDFIKTNKIPVPFISMIITQFIFIIIDRALFLKKQVKGKFIFQIFHALLIHAWLFFALPYITKKKFHLQVAPQILYIVKCIYFGLSAYQMKSGYPLKILGNFLTKNYKYVNLFLFKGYMVIPFLYELRNVMDWMWTDSSVALYHWMEVEDVFCKIFVLKCWRYAELRWPTARGINSRFYAKYIIGGFLLLVLFICLWGPLTVSSFIGNTFVKNPPIECSFSINVGGYSPLFVFSSREDYLKPLAKDTFHQMKECYQHHTSSTDYLKSFEVGDVTEILIDIESDDVWLITPPGFAKLKKKLLSSKETLKINTQLICERGVTDSKTTEKVVRYTQSRVLNSEEKIQFLKTMEYNNTNSSFVYLPHVFPRFLTAYKQKLLEARPLLTKGNNTFLNIGLSMKESDSVIWWEITETVYGETYCSINSENTKKRTNTTIYIFNERVSDHFFGNIFSNYGIIGIYAAYFFVVHRVLRTFYSNISYITRYEELPNVDRILKLLRDIYLVRENKMFLLEEQLIAKLLFLYRSSETMIKWTCHKKSIIREYTAAPSVNKQEGLSTDR